MYSAILFASLPFCINYQIVKLPNCQICILYYYVPFLYSALPSFLLRDQQKSVRDERKMPRDEQKMPRDERKMARDERKMARDERKLPREQPKRSKTASEAQRLTKEG